MAKMISALSKGISKNKQHIEMTILEIITEKKLS